ncbi:MAG: anthranilate phosphoribosyltransferase [Anaerolineales bacterium]
MIAVIDNYDSFTYNLVQFLGELGAEVEVFRNDRVTVEQLAERHPTHLVVSPGPGTPDDAGVSSRMIAHFSGRIPVLGVCLGHQCIGAVYGAKVGRAAGIMHGKSSRVHHNGTGLLAGLPSPLEAGRYHSLIVFDPVPAELEVLARAETGEIMAIRHKSHPTFGLQFHPESVLTAQGKQILKNFLALPAAKAAVSEKKEDTNMLKPFIAQAMRRENLSADQAEQAMMVIMTGGATPAQIGSYLTAMRMKGETIDEITGSARGMRANALPVNFDRRPQTLYDTAGTGGDGAGTFNFSTAAAFVIAGTGRKVAKHGNRAASSKCGSADVLAALGVNIDMSPEMAVRAIDEVGIAFFFAAKYHPAMKHAIGPRREIGQRTIFNLLGPLTNPAGADVQVIGVPDPALTEPLAKVLGSLGARAAYVVHGYGGLDELNAGGPNRVSHLKDGAVRTFDFDPRDAGIPRADPSELRGGTAEENAAMMKAVLAGKSTPAVRDAVLLNAAAAIAAESGDFPEALAEARRSLSSGAALKVMEGLIAFK